MAPGEEPQRAEEYRPQLEAYAQALERVMEEKVCRKVLYFFSTGATKNLKICKKCLHFAMRCVIITVAFVKEDYCTRKR